MKYCSFRFMHVTINSLDCLGRNSTYNGMRRHILCHHRARCNYGSLPDCHTICNDHAGSEPNVIFDHDPLRCNPLINKGSIRIVKNMIDRDNLGKRGCVNPISDLNTALPAHDTILADQAVTTNLDARLWHTPEVVYMQYRAMHYDGPSANFDPIRGRVKIS